MTAPGGSGGSVGAVLRAVSGPKLYADNAFRVAGLDARATRADIRRRRQAADAAASLGVALPDGRDPDEVRAALDRLTDPRRRLVEEIFAPWAAPGTGDGVAADHDRLVDRHADLIDAERHATPGDRTVAWNDTTAAWTKLLARPEFWTHLGRRVADLDDPRLAAGAVDELRDELPAALVAPLVALAAEAPDPRRLVAVARAWPLPAGEPGRMLTRAAAPLRTDIEHHLHEAGRLLDAGQPHRTATLVGEQLRPALTRLGALTGDGCATEEARRAAILLNNAATTLIDDSLAELDTALAWLDQARRLTTDPDASELIRSNRDAVSSARIVLRQARSDIERAFRAGGHPGAQRAFGLWSVRLRDQRLIAELVAFVASLPAGRPVEPLRPYVGYDTPPPVHVDWQGVGCGVFGFAGLVGVVVALNATPTSRTGAVLLLVLPIVVAILAIWWVGRNWRQK